MYSLSDLIALFALVLAIVWWWRASAVKQRALGFVRRQCRQRGLQLLDQSLVFRRYRLLSPGSGGRRWCRVYEFDFSIDGEDRHHGELSLAGERPLRLVLAGPQTEVADF